MFLDPRTQVRQGHDLTVREGSSVFARSELDPFGAAVRAGHDGDALVSQAALDYLSGRGVGDEVVGVDHPRDDGLTETRVGVYNGLTALPRDRVRGEQDAGDRRVDHPLHDDGEAHTVRVDPVRSPVADGTIRPQRGPATPHRVEHGLDTDDVKVRILLARKARLGQVLSRGRRTNGHRNGFPVSQASVGLRDGPPEKIGNACVGEVGSCLGGELGQTRRVFRLRSGQRGKRGLQPCIRCHHRVCCRGDTEPVRHRKSGPDELAEVRRLAAGHCQRALVYRIEG